MSYLDFIIYERLELSTSSTSNWLGSGMVLLLPAGVFDFGENTRDMPKIDVDLSPLLQNE